MTKGEDPNTANTIPVRRLVDGRGRVYLPKELRDAEKTVFMYG
jgi:hypothetical protein